MVRNLKNTCIKGFVVTAYLFHLLVGRLYGIFIFSIILYFSAPAMGLSKPYNPHELIMWLDQLPENYKISVLTSLSILTTS